MDNINLIVLDWMIAERELYLKVNEKNTAVRNQQFDVAAKLLEEQREIESRLPTIEQLKEMKKLYQ
jgi:DNA-binding winged helix-turn-helix (wHTH) protein